MNEQELLDAVIDQYLGSRDFNGLPGYTVARQHQVDLQSLQAMGGSLIASGQVAVLFGDIHPNPHIRAFEDEPRADQLVKLAAAKDDRFVLYPTPAVLLERVDPHQYEGRPFTLRLARGQGREVPGGEELRVVAVTTARL